MTGPILLYSVLKSEHEKDLQASTRKRKRSADEEGELHERLPKRLKVSSMTWGYARASISLRMCVLLYLLASGHSLKSS